MKIRPIVIIISALFLILSSYTSFSQETSHSNRCGFSSIPDINHINPDKEFDNILVNKLCSDSLSTSFLIWVKNGVKKHKHVTHSETIFVLEGEAKMQLGERSFQINAGDFIFIPFNTPHNVKVTSARPLKVLSIQSPEFIGNDRVFIE